ncbi:MAG: hypothetical protein C0615_11170 [Desulfuromonas sp.]|nr:MAG: hypothetical protein C0615_11170 [Desulfuromonas sp.]
MKYSILFLFSILVFLSGCSAPKSINPCDFESNGPRPGWADLDYPPGNKLYGIGISSPVLKKPDGSPNGRLDKKKAAQIAAKADLAEQLNTEIFSQLEEEIVARESDDSSSMTIDVRSLVKTTTQRQMGFVRYEDTWQDGETCTVYVLASMPGKYVDMMIGQFKEVVGR